MNTGLLVQRDLKILANSTYTPNSLVARGSYLTRVATHFPTPHLATPHLATAIGQQLTFTESSIWNLPGWAGTGVALADL